MKKVKSFFLKVLGHSKCFIFLLGLFFIFSYSLQKVLSTAYKQLTFIKNRPFYTYDEKMREKWGKFYDYMIFVRNNTPKDAVIAIPPQMSPWYTTGNGALVYYFLYPRIPSNSSLKELAKNEKLTYVLLVKGDSDDNKESIWPKFKVNAQKTIYYPSKTYLNDWGIMELK